MNNPYKLSFISACKEFLAGINKEGKLFLLNDASLVPGYKDITQSLYKISQISQPSKNKIWGLSKKESLLLYDNEKSTWTDIPTTFKIKHLSSFETNLWLISVIYPFFFFFCHLL